MPGSLPSCESNTKDDGSSQRPNSEASSDASSSVTLDKARDTDSVLSDDEEALEADGILGPRSRMEIITLNP